MKRSIGVLAAVVAILGVIGTNGASAATAPSTAQRVLAAAGDPVASGPAPEVLVNTPWGKDDTTGDVADPEGDLRRIIVENGRAQMHFTFRTVATPIWDTPSNDRATGMVFDMDWQGTTTPPNRELIVGRQDGVWFAAIVNARNVVVCSRSGGVRQLSNHRFQISAPVELCLGGPHVLRVASGFVDDHDDSSAVDATVDAAPNSRFYGPFIRLPAPGHAREASGRNGWTVH